jgi:hypothetical protein
MTKKKKFLILARVVFMFFAVLFVALVVALSKIDMNNLRGALLGILQNATGMPIEITGDVSWKLSLRPHVTMNKVEIPNPSGKGNLFEAKSIDVRLNLVSLFFNRPTIQNITLNDAKLYLKRDSAGKYNLSFLNQSDDSSDSVQPDYPFSDPGLGGLFINNFVVNTGDEQYTVPQISVRYNSFSMKSEYKGWIKSDSVVIPFVAVFNKYNAERKVYPVSLAFSVGGDALVANIALEGTSKIPIDFIIKGTIPDARPIGKLFNLDLPDMPELRVNISGGLGHKKLTLHKSSVAMRAGELNISGIWDWGNKQPEIKAKISSRRLNLAKATIPEIYSNVEFPNGYVPNVFRDMPLFGEFMYNKRISVTGDFADLIVYRNLSLTNLHFDMGVRNAHIRIDAKTGFADGEIIAAIDGDIEETGKMNLAMGGVGSNVTIGKLLSQINVNDFISELPMDFQMYVRASGSDMSGIMKTITGPLRVYSSGKGYAHSELVAYMYGEDFLTSLRNSIQDMFRSKKKHDQMTINSVVANLKLRNGLIETQNGVAVETNAINILLSGDVDLGREKLKLSLTTVPVSGLKLSISGQVVNTITISGNLAEPEVKISGAAVAGKALSATGIGLMLAPLTGGIGLVAGAGLGLVAGDLLENWLADEHPAKTALKKGAPTKDGDPDWMDVPALDLAQSVIKSDVTGADTK